MTVCIAATCHTVDGRPVLIVAADRMITIGEIEYEPQQTKIVELATRTVCLLAGNMSVHASVVARARQRIREALEDDPSNIDVARIAEIYAEEFAYFRRSRAERAILYPIGLNFDRYLARQSAMAHYQVAEIEQRLSGYFVDSMAVIAGIDPSGAHIYVVQDPGVADSMDTQCFACIGSGGWVAQSQFMVAGFNKFWDPAKTLWMAFQAKARAETAGGVGSATDLAVILPGEQPITYLTTDQKESLYDLFREARAKEDVARAEAERKLEAYIRQAGAPASGDQSQTTTPPEGAGEEGDTQRREEC